MTALLAVVSALWGSEARAQTSVLGCTPITRVPFEIGRPGSYCVIGTQALEASSGAAITIAADFVTLDLSRGGLEGTGGPSTRAIGVLARNRRHVTVRGGWIRGFRFGVLFADNAVTSEENVVERVDVFDSAASGIAVTGANCKIRGCRVVNTGGRGPFAVGISQTGSFATVMSNGVWRTHADASGGYAAGIDLTHGSNEIVSSNSVHQVSQLQGQSYGIRCGAPFARLNVVVGAAIPFSTCVAPSPDPGPYPYPDPYAYPQPYSYPFPYPYPFSQAGQTYGWVVGALAGVLGLAARRWWPA